MAAAVRIAAFTLKRNLEIAASMAATDRAREAQFADARNREIDVSMTRVAHQQLIAFTATRNVEAELSMARVNGESAMVALGRIAPYLGAGGIETASIRR
jgi:hypothetical protein